MSRCAILSSPPIPVIMPYWMDLFKNWENEVDKVYFCTSLPLEGKTRKFVKKTLNHPKIEIFDNLGGWPLNLNNVLKQVKEDTVCVLHDDTFIYKHGIMDKYFKMAESGIVVVPPNNPPTKYIKEIIELKYPWNSGYTFLLYFLFISMKNLRKTSMDFSGGHFNGYCDLLDMDLKEEIGGDTGFIIWLELLKAQVKIVDLPSYRPDFFMDNLIEEMKKWKVNWLHAWTLGYVFSDIDNELKAANMEPQVKESFAYRLAFLKEFLEYDFSEIPEYRDEMVTKGKLLAEHYNLDDVKIKIYQDILKGFKQ